MVTTKEYYKSHTEEIKAYQKRYREENREKWREKNNRWQLANPEKMSTYRNKYSRSPKGSFHRLKGRAKHDSINFNMRVDEFLHWWGEQNLKCHYCEAELDFSDGQKKMNGYSIDRKDNSIGYQINNIVFSYNRCNMVTGSVFPDERILEITRKSFE